MVAVRHLAVVVEGRRRRHGGEGRVTSSQRASASGLLILYEGVANHLVMVSFVDTKVVGTIIDKIFGEISDEVTKNFSLTVVLRWRDHGFISLATSSSPPTVLLSPLPFFHNTRGTDDALGQ